MQILDVGISHQNSSRIPEGSWSRQQVRWRPSHYGMDWNTLTNEVNGVEKNLGRVQLLLKANSDAHGHLQVGQRCRVLTNWKLRIVLLINPPEALSLGAGGLSTRLWSWQQTQWPPLKNHILCLKIGCSCNAERNTWLAMVTKAMYYIKWQQ